MQLYAFSLYLYYHDHVQLHALKNQFRPKHEVINDILPPLPPPEITLLL